MSPDCTPWVKPVTPLTDGYKQFTIEDVTIPHCQAQHCPFKGKARPQTHRPFGLALKDQVEQQWHSVNQQRPDFMGCSGALRGDHAEFIANNGTTETDVSNAAPCVNPDANPHNRASSNTAPGGDFLARMQKTYGGEP